MNSNLAQFSFTTAPRASTERRLDVLGATVSALLHVVALLIMLSPALQSRSRAHASSQAQAIQVSLLNEQQEPSPDTPQPMGPPKELRPVTDQPTPLPTAKPVPKSAPQKKSAQPTISSTQTSTDTSRTINDSEEMEDVSGRIHDLWLQPPGIGQNFRCHVRIKYAIGGAITGIDLLQGCGAAAADASIKRAIWKIQSLPLQSAKHEAGSFEMDFTP